jgi:hypothetical protein
LTFAHSRKLLSFNMFHPPSYIGATQKKKGRRRNDPRLPFSGAVCSF